METKTQITVSTTVNLPVQKAWDVWNQPHHIMNWSFASPDWHTPKSENDVRTGGKFSSTMAAKDGSMSFDFAGEYTRVELHKIMEYALTDGRKVQIQFEEKNGQTTITETFEAEGTNPIEMQRAGWQAIIDNYKQYAKSLKKMSKLHFEIFIEAPVETVYKNMLEDKPYREWTAAFNPGSYFEGTWEKGSKILFLGPDSKQNEDGMVARIAENIPNQFVSIEHLGLVSGGKEITSGPEVDGWAGAHEDYTFKSQNGGTLLLIDLDSNQEYKKMFEEMWPKALQKLKEICEK